MLNISGYKINKEIYSGKETIIYKAILESNKSKVILKLLKSEDPTEKEIEKFKTEYDIIKQLNLNGVIKNYEFININNICAIAMEDFDGVPLGNIIKKKPLDVKQFLKIAIQITQILDELHKQNIIHKDLNPENILINEKTGEVKIIDFSISSKISREIQVLTVPEKLEGNLLYISPEQTGRMNRSIDYRTDFYSLGVTFYQCLTAVPPFILGDPLELIHSHIARTPIPPHELNPEVPPQLSKIIIKMMAKTPEDRYQSTQGLKYDFEECLNQLNKNGWISNFDIAQNDISEKLQIPEKIYGRESEVKELVSVFDKICKGNKEIRLFNGSAGIGKSSLINELHKYVIETRGYFITGKYENLERNIPFFAIKQSFQDLITQLLTESDEKIKYWKNEILDTIGNNGQILIDFIPNIELIIGKQKEVQSLPPQETTNRFHLVIQSFIKRFANFEHPLVLFLDDLQWSDASSLKLLEVLFSDFELSHFLFIGTYRNDEIDHSHPLNIIFNKTKKEFGESYININLKPLNVENINEMLSDTLYCTKEKVVNIANVINEKSGGNPFFINQILNTFYSEGLIEFNKCWNWDIDKIKQANITDNVVELMSEKIKKLSKISFEYVKIASCIGVTSNLKFLSIVTEKKEEQIIEYIKNAINEGLIVKIGSDLKFVHDRVRDAAYSLIDKKEKKLIHYKIGKNLLDNEGKLDNENIIFSITGHLNMVKDILNTEEKKKLIDLNLKSGIKAKESTSFDIALSYFKEGMELLENDSWILNYEITLELFTNRAEAEYLNGNFTKADEYFELILKKTKKELDNVKIYELKILSLASRLKMMEAIHYGIDILKKFGITIPKKPGQMAALPEILKANFRIGKRDPIELLNLPEMKDLTKLAAVRILMTLGPICYLADTSFVPLISLKIVNLSLKYGNCSSSAFGYATFGFIKCGVFGEIKQGYQLGQLALKLVDKYNDKYLKSEIHYVLGAFINHWIYHTNTVKNILLEGYLLSLETGNISYIGYNLDDFFCSKFVTGENLNTLNSDFIKFLSVLYKTKDESSILYLEPYRQITLNLIQETKNPTMLNGIAYNEEITIKKLLDANNNVCLAAYYHVKIILLYLFEDYEKGFELYKTGEKFIKTAFAKFQPPEFYFYSGLIVLAHFDKLDKKRQTIYMHEIKKILKQFEKWSKFCNDNFIHKILLIKAEIARINSNNDQAMNFYDESIKKAKEYEYKNIEAIANECAGKYYLSKNMNKVAGFYLLEARNCYFSWGAITKVKHLEEKYKEIFESIRNNSLKIMHSDSILSETWSRNAGFLDIMSVVKASQSISSEFEMDKLLMKLIEILIENTGAEKGALIFVKDDKITIEVESSIKNKLKIVSSIPIDENHDISGSIIRYVIKTKEDIVLEDASKKGYFTNDPYIKSNKILSVMCIPILSHGNVIGAAYLENNLSTNVFTKNRLEIIKILSSQAAISLENARSIVVQREKDRLENEMELAERIQTSLVPTPPIHDELEISAFIKPAEEVGGDYYDILYDSLKNLWFAIGDVTGHGVTPGLIMMMAETALNNKIEDANVEISPKDVLISINKTLSKNIRIRLKENHYMTMLLLKYSGKGNFSYAGSHLDIIIYRDKEKKIEFKKTEGLYIGILPDISTKTKEFDFKLNVNDFMVIYTDGITEAKNFKNKNDFFGIERLAGIIEKNPGESPEKIKDLIISQTLSWSNNKLDDDITLVVTKRIK